MAQQDGGPGGMEPCTLPFLNMARTVLSREFGLAPVKPAAFRRAVSSHHSVVKRLSLQRVLYGHQGCVNTCSFTPDGGTLLTGSDDLSVIFWDWQRGYQRLKYSSGHNGNVFQARAMPFADNNTIVTSAADGQVRVGFVREGGSGKSVETCRVANHHGRAHKLALQPHAAQCFYSCGEDGAVRHFDLRENHYGNRKLLTVMARRFRWQRKVELYGLAVNPCSPWQMALAGGEECVRVYDLRKCGPNRHASSSSANSGPVEPLYQLCPHHMKHSRGYHTTCVAYSRRGQLLATYGEDHIYLFDYEQRGRGSSRASRPKTHRNTRSRRRGSLSHKAGDLERTEGGIGRTDTARGRGVVGPSSEADNSNDIPHLTDDSSNSDDVPDLLDDGGSSGDRSGADVSVRPGANQGTDIAAEAQGPSKLPRIDLGESSHGTQQPEAGERLGDDVPAEARLGNSRRKSGAAEHGRMPPASLAGPGESPCIGPTDMPRSGGRRQPGGIANDSEGSLHPNGANVQEFFGESGSDTGSEGNGRVEEEDEEEDESQEDTEDEDDSSMPSLDPGSLSSSSSLEFSEDSMPDLMEESSSSDEDTGVDHLVPNQHDTADDFVVGRFSGHVNNRTVKGVAFMGDSDEYVISGSDCGNIFLWDADTTKLLWAQPGDTAVVNCLEPHPLLPLTLSTSGIDPTVKIWDPSHSSQRRLDLHAMHRGYMEYDARELIHLLAAHHNMPEDLIRRVNSNLANVGLGGLPGMVDDTNEDTDDEAAYVEHPPCLMQ